MGTYPLLVCDHWEGLREDLTQIGDLISLTGVTDPFGAFSDELLRECFPDLVRPYKRHLITDLWPPLEETAAAHHRRNVRRARVEVEECADAGQWGDDWVRLYGELVQRRRIAGVAAFPEQCLRDHLAVPGVRVWRAWAEGRVVGMQLWMQMGECGYYHLAAYDEAGYRLRASFALFWRAAETFRREGLRWLSLGAGAGTEEDPASGLVRFKRGWATGYRWTYLCGRVFDRTAYRVLTTPAARASGYFPSYRYSG
jgi:hypothetical protein